MAIKLIGIDIDGTLLTRKKELTSATVEALQAAADHGIHVVISTGRLLSEFRDLVERLPMMRYTVTCTGCQVIDLQTDGTYRIECAEGWNELLVKDGEISVSSASCPSQDCVHTPPADRGAPIVCLPHRMVIRFSAETENMDALLR